MLQLYTQYSAQVHVSMSSTQYANPKRIIPYNKASNIWNLSFNKIYTRQLKALHNSSLVRPINQIAILFYLFWYNNRSTLVHLFLIEQPKSNNCANFALTILINLSALELIIYSPGGWNSKSFISVMKSKRPIFFLGWNICLVCYMCSPLKVPLCRQWICL